MCDRGSKGAVLGAFRIGVDPLLVIRGIGEQVDLLLGDLTVIGGAKVLAGHGEQGVEIDDEIGHLCLLCCCVLVCVVQWMKALSPVRARPTMRALISWVPS
ncbi:hypothetical protein D3C85_1671860 [compost metagenome]